MRDNTEKTTIRLQQCLQRMHQGLDGADHELIAVARERLLLLTRTMYRSFPRLRRFEDTDDVFQSAMFHFSESLRRITPRDLRDFFALAGLHIRRTLLDLCRRYLGPQGAATRELASVVNGNDSEPTHELADVSPTAEALLLWGEFHQQIGELPSELREVFELTWYHGLTQQEISDILEVSSRTIRKRWRESCHLLYKRLQGQIPPT